MGRGEGQLQYRPCQSVLGHHAVRSSQWQRIGCAQIKKGLVGASSVTVAVGLFWVEFSLVAEPKEIS